jgi:hypothetical protein
MTFQYVSVDEAIRRPLSPANCCSAICGKAIYSAPSLARDMRSCRGQCRPRFLCPSAGSSRTAMGKQTLGCSGCRQLGVIRRQTHSDRDGC